jgi:hypothetical protein
MCQLDAQMQLTPLLPAAQPPSGPHIKRRKTSTAAFFAESDESEEDSEEEEEAVKDELEAYLVLPQVKCATEQEVLNWWRDHADEFPNLAVMARQYLGCPASSAAVERLFSQVGIAFSAKRKSAGAATLQHLMFARCNLPYMLKFSVTHITFPHTKKSIVYRVPRAR